MMTQPQANNRPAMMPQLPPGIESNKMMTFSVSPLGSADKQNLSVLEKPIAGQQFNLNPVLQNFSSNFGPMFTEALKKDPDWQTKLFDMDNLVKKNAGIFRKQEDGLGEFGMDADGGKLWAAPETANDNILGMGENQLQSTGIILDKLGAFRNQEEAAQFVARTKAASNPRFHGSITASIQGGNKKEAMDQILQTYGQPLSSDFEKDFSNKAAVGAAFAAHNIVENWDKMNDTQRSLSLSGLGMATYKFGEEDVSKRILIDSKSPGGPKLTVGNALAFASSGIDVMSLQKNWDQIDMLQRLTGGGKGTSSQMVATARQLGFLGDASDEGAAVGGLKAEELGKLGFRSSPSAGMGAIVGPSGSLPKGFSPVAAGAKEGEVIAMPDSLIGTAATMNGSAKIVTLGSAQGSTPAGAGAYQIHSRWSPMTGKKGDNTKTGGTLVGAALQRSAAQNPYLASSIITASVYGNTVNPPSSKVPSATQQLIQSQAGKEAAKQIGTQVGQQVAGGAPTITGKLPNGNTQLSDGSIVGADGKFVKKGDYAAKGAEYAGYALAVYNGYNIMTNDNLNTEQKGAGMVQVGAQTYGAYAGGSAVAGGVGAAAGIAMTAMSDNMTNEQKATRMQQQAGLAVADYWTGGLASLAEGALRSNPYTAKQLGKIDKLDQKYNPMTIGLAKIMGGKNEDQQGRDTARTIGQNAKFIDEKYGVTLFDGTKVDVGIDGKGGQHEFRNPQLVPEGNEVRTLSAYDVDYTNDLDFSANMMTNSLMRLVSGGKGKHIDQFGGQLANAAISKIGFGQDMTEDNFNQVQANIRGWFFQSGVKTKEDAYALANQAVHEERITEADLMAIQQGINMTFDDNGLETANQLMSGRWNGLKVANDLPNSPGPNMQFIPSQQGAAFTKPYVFPTTSAQGAGLSVGVDEPVAQKPGSFAVDPGSYWGNNDGMFSSAITQYKDPWLQQLADSGYLKPLAPKRTNLMTREELKLANQAEMARA